MPFLGYSQTYKQHVYELYNSCKLKDKMSYKLFEKGVTGFYNLKYENKISGDVLVIVDFRQSSNQERLYIIDLDMKILIYMSKVAHGVKSGNRYAISFSNEKNSWKSSLGFFITSEKYKGINGLSLRLDGLDEGYNDNARDRNIVIHGAEYVDSLSVGHSKGCIAIPKKDAETIINVIRSNNCLFIYNKDYKGIVANKRLNEKVAEEYYNKIKPTNELLKFLKN